MERETSLAANKCYDAFPPIPACQAVSCLCQSKWHASSACYMMALLMNLGLLCLGLLPSRRRLHECLQNSLQTMCPWSKTFLCTSQNDEPLPGRNALPNVAIDEKRAAATVFSHCSWGYFLFAALFFFVYAQSIDLPCGDLFMAWVTSLQLFCYRTYLQTEQSDLILLMFGIGYTSFIFFQKKHMKQCSRIKFQL